MRPRGARRPTAVQILVVLLTLASASAVWAQTPGGTPSETRPPQSSTPSAPEPTKPLTPAVPAWPATPRFTPPATVPSTPAPVSLPSPDVTPPAATFEVEYLLGVAEEYSDNFRLSDTDKQDNFRSSISPGIRLGINGAKTRGLISYILTGTYDTLDDETGLFHSLLAAVTWQATPRLSLTLSETFVRSDENSQADRLSLRRNREPFIRNTFMVAPSYSLAPLTATAYYRLTAFLEDDGRDTITHLLGATADTSFYESNILTVGYEYLKSDTSDGQATSSSGSLGSEGVSDVTGHRVFGSFTRQFNPLTSGGIAGSYGFRQTNDVNYDLWSVSLFATRSVGPLSLSGSVGYSQVIRETGGTDSSILTATTLVYRFAQGVFTLGFDSGFAETYADGENFGVVETRGVTATVSYPFTPFITGSAGGFYRQSETTGETGGGARDQDTWGASASLAIRLARWLTMVLDYSHVEASRAAILESTSQNGGGYTENRARISLNAAF